MHSRFLSEMELHNHTRFGDHSSIAQPPGRGILQVLLVEPHDSVRHCMLLYLRAHGALVKAVCSEDQAVASLRLQGDIPLHFKDDPPWKDASVPD